MLLRYSGDFLNLEAVEASAGRFDGPVLVLHGHLHAVACREGRLLQIGVPAVVEWPHVWTGASIETAADGTVAVRTALVPIPGSMVEGRRRHRAGCA